MILPYLIKSTLCLALLFGFYKVALEGKAMHQFKRFYLIASLVFAYTIPLVTFTYETDVAIIEPIVDVYLDNAQPLIQDVAIASEPFTNYIPIILWSIYTLGVLIFGVRFILNLVRLKRKIDSSQRLEEKEFTLALLGQNIIPHSFLKWIFLNQVEYQKQEIATEVIAHEATHVRQKHSWDILFIEFLQVVFWFNPLIWFSRTSIKLNHEFLADQGAIKNKSNIAIYQNILLSYASCTHHTALESPFNYSLTKKRIVMLSQSFSRKKLFVRGLLLIPIAGLCMLLFNQAIVAQPAPENQLTNFPNEDQKEKIYARIIDISIVNQNNYRVNNIAVSKTALKASLKNLHRDLSKKERDDVINIHVSGNGKISYTDLVFIQKIASEYGYHRIVTPNEEIIRSKGNTPMKPSEISGDGYAQQFIEGAQRNGKNAIVIEAKNDSIYINGNYTPLNVLRKNIDTATANWTKEDYADPIRSIIFKGNSEDFINRAEKEFQKTKLFKGNNTLRLIPPPPPTIDFPNASSPPPPPSPDFASPHPPPALPSSVDHLRKMNDLSGLFYNENKNISYDQAVNLVKSNKNLNVRTPYPYSNPPETYISLRPSSENVQGIKVISNSSSGVTPKELATYNRLAKKYNIQPKATRKIPLKDLKVLETIYRQMTNKQKKENQPFPECDTSNLKKF